MHDGEHFVGSTLTLLQRHAHCALHWNGHLFAMLYFCYMMIPLRPLDTTHVVTPWVPIPVLTLLLLITSSLNSSPYTDERTPRLLLCVDCRRTHASKVAHHAMVYWESEAPPATDLTSFE